MNSLCALLEEGLLLVVEVELDDSLDAAFAKHAGHADAEVALAIFRLREVQTGDNCILVVDDGLNNFCSSSAGSIPCRCAEKF